MKRTLIYGSNTLIAIALFAAILILVNVLPKELKAVNVFGTRVPLQKKWDLTENKRFTLTDQTVKVLARLDTPTDAIGFAQKGTPSYTDLEDMLKQYAFQSPSFKYRIEDPVRNPTVAQQYGIKSMRTLIMEYKGADGKSHKETVTLPPAGQGSADYEQMESKITAGLMRLINPKPATVYFTKGHGEAPIDDPNPQTGLGSMKSSLEGENYTVKSLSLTQDKSVPADASLVIIAGLAKDFLPEEIQALQKYMAGGGRVMLFYNIEPMRMQGLPNIDKFLTTQGIAAQNDVVVSRTFADLGSPLTILAPAVEKYGNSPITERFTVPTIYPVTRSFKVDKPLKDSTVTPLATTSDDSWVIKRPLTQDLLVAIARRDFNKVSEEAKDTKGAAIVAVAGKYSAVPTDLELAPQEKPAFDVPGAPSSGLPSPMAAPSSAPSAVAQPASPAPGASGSPAPGASGSPAGASSGSPATAASGSPAPAASGAPEAAASGVPGASPSGAPNAKPKTEARLVVFGSKEMIQGSFFGLMGNGDIVMNSIAWLTERTEQIAISRPEIKKQPLTLDETSQRRVDWLAMPLLPCMVGLIGLFIHTLAKRH